MGPGQIIGIICAALGAVLLALIFVIVIRTLMFKPKKEDPIDETPVEFDSERSLENLRKLIQCKTVSYKDHSLEDEAEFEKLYALLPKLYPEVYKNCTLTKLPDRALLFHWKGESPDLPTVLMAHYDVVPVNMDQWSVNPFEALVKDGVLYGRGALDTKITFNGVLFACNHMMEQGFTPKNDVYMAFSGGEEINGMGAVNIVNWFIEHKITPNMVVDEGGAVVENIFPGVKGKCGVIGIAEKGMMNVEWTCKSPGGHASAPKPHSPVVELANGVKKVEDHPTKRHLTKPVAEMYDVLGRRSTFLYRMIFANQWAFGGLLDSICKKGGGNLNALMRTTVAFTQMEGSSASNVIPPVASVVTNIRINPADTIDTVVDYLNTTIDNPNIKLRVYDSMNPSPISETDCDQWKRIKGAVASTWKGAIVAPYLMVQCSDSRHYGKISNHVYRFSSYDVSAEELATIHGNDERVHLDAQKRSQEFFIRLVKTC